MEAVNDCALSKKLLYTELSPLSTLLITTFFFPDVFVCDLFTRIVILFILAYGWLAANGWAVLAKRDVAFPVSFFFSQVFGHIVIFFLSLFFFEWRIDIHVYLLSEC